MTMQAINDKISLFEEMVATIDAHHRNTKSAWELRKEIMADFKSTDFDNAQLRQTAWQRFFEVGTLLWEKQSRILEENKRFAAKANEDLESFAALLKKDLTLDSPDYQQAQLLFSRLYVQLRQAYWPSSEERAAFAQKFEALTSHFVRLSAGLMDGSAAALAAGPALSTPLAQKLMLVISACSLEADELDLLHHLQDLEALLSAEGLLAEEMYWVPNKFTNKPAKSLTLKQVTLRRIHHFITTNKELFAFPDFMKLFDAKKHLQAAVNSAIYDQKLDAEARLLQWASHKKEVLAKLMHHSMVLYDARLRMLKNLELKQNEVGRRTANLEPERNYIQTLRTALEELEVNQAQYTETGELSEAYAGLLADKKAHLKVVDFLLNGELQKIDYVAKNSEDIQRKLANLAVDAAAHDKKIEEVMTQLSNWKME